MLLSRDTNKCSKMQESYKNMPVTTNDSEILLRKNTHTWSTTTFQLINSKLHKHPQSKKALTCILATGKHTPVLQCSSHSERLNPIVPSLINYVHSYSIPAEIISIRFCLLCKRTEALIRYLLTQKNY